MMKPTFKNHERPLFTVMLQQKTPEEMIDVMQKSIQLGADAFGIQFESLDEKYRNPEVYKKLFAAAGGLPTYVTNYRHRSNEGKTDDQLADELVELVECGATLADIMGDMFCPHPEEMTDNAQAIEKQKALVEKIHKAGGEVLMSSHVLKYIPAERVIEIAKAQEERGVDIVKIVTGAENDIQQGENLKIAAMLKNELNIPYLYLAGGNCRVLRRVGPMLGVCMWLCVYEHHEFSTKMQPTLKKAKAIWENFSEDN